MKKIIFLFAFLTTYQLSEGRRMMEVWIPGDFNFEDAQFYTNQKKIINVMWDFDKGAILPQSYGLLDSMVLFLKVNPGITIDISVHTDHRGNDKYNLKLTERRVKAIGDYLITKGINEKRFKTIGAGETEPIISEKEIKKTKDKNAQEILHQRNRRTEIKITNINTPMDKSPLLIPTGNWIYPDVETMKLLTGEGTASYQLTTFSQFRIIQMMEELLKKDADDLISHKKTYIVYHSKECHLNVLVLISNSVEEEAVLFSDNGNSRVYKYNNCFKSWTEVK